ncbi:MAG: hypothetical protein ACREIC_10140 [Limisphaerales bacterium]
MRDRPIVLSVAAPTGVGSVLDKAATNRPRGFYRAVLLPWR